MKYILVIWQLIDTSPGFALVAVGQYPNAAECHRAAQRAEPAPGDIRPASHLCVPAGPEAPR